MNCKPLSPLRLTLLLAVIVLVVTPACAAESTGPRTWIDYPRDQAVVPAGTSLPVISHAYAGEGVADVLFSVNGVAYRRVPPVPSGPFVKAQHDWLPDKPGDYVLQVTAFTPNGAASNPATIRVRVQGKLTATPPPTPTPTPTIDRTVTVVPLPDLAIVSVEPVVVGYKGDTPLCDIRVVYRNSGTGMVPRDYVLQSHLNGRPLASQTRGAGFPPGGVSEAIFAYQFVDTAYIGINLDSTDTVVESNELNNAFAEARLCTGAPSPITPPPTFTPTPTHTPVAGAPILPVQASLRADPTTIDKGKCALLSWDVENATGVFLDNQGVSGHDSQQVCPESTTTYTLRVNAASGNVTRTVTVSVRQPPNTHTPTPTRTRTPTVKPADTQGPPAPALVSPKGTLSCRSTVTLDWNAVSDPSGIKQYYVKWARNGGSSGGTTTTGTQHSISVQCGYNYTWSVRAEDKAGNAGGWGNASFTIQAIH